MQDLSPVQRPFREKSSSLDNHLNQDARELFEQLQLLRMQNRMRYNGSASETGESTVAPQVATCKKTERRGFIHEEEAGDEEEKEIHICRRMPLKSLGNMIDVEQGIFNFEPVVKKNTPTKHSDGNVTKGATATAPPSSSSSSSSTSTENDPHEPICSTSEYSKLSIGISKPSYEAPNEYGINPLVHLGIMHNFHSFENKQDEDCLSWDLSPRSWDSSPGSLDDEAISIGGMLSDALWVIQEVDEESTACSEVSNKTITRGDGTAADECSHTDELDWEHVEQGRLQCALGPLLGTKSFNQQNVNYYEDKPWEEDEHPECPSIFTNCFLGVLSNMFVGRRKQDCLVVAVEDSQI